MNDWNFIETAPKDGTLVLLWARLGSNPPSANDFYPIVGFWHSLIEPWKVAPEHLNQEEHLIASFWAPIPAPPN
jgi:hypothetical protein